MTFYLKYRPKNLEELDLVEVAEALKKIVASGNIPHALLFSGPKGTGKTSAARILAKVVNCTSLQGINPCNKCDQCVSTAKGSNLDVIEMDAASHRGIDDIRILRDAVKLAPVNARKKIYIIDEAHMLTTEASNALLKTLEEPPDHVLFVLATTNPEKLIGTIRSRVTTVTFKKANTEEIVRSLKRVAGGEKIKITDGALEIIAQASDGAFRDAIKVLEQVVSEEKDLSKESLEEYLFSRKAFDLDAFLDLLIKKDTKIALEEIGKFGSKGVSVEGFLEALLNKLRGHLLANEGVGSMNKIDVEKSSLISLIELLSDAYRDISTSPIEELPLEIAIIKWCEGGGGSKLATEKQEKEQGKSPAPDSKSVPTINDAKVNPSSNVLLSEVNDEIWKTILSMVKPINASVEALLRAARPVGYDGKILTLGVYYKFHKERLEDTQHRMVLEDIVGRVLSLPTKVVCTLVEPPLKKVVEEAKTEPVLTEGADNDIMKAAEEIFGN